MSHQKKAWQHLTAFLGFPTEVSLEEQAQTRSRLHDLKDESQREIVRTWFTQNQANGPQALQDELDLVVVKDQRSFFSVLSLGNHYLVVDKNNVTRLKQGTHLGSSRNFTMVDSVLFCAARFSHFELLQKLLSGILPDEQFQQLSLSDEKGNQLLMVLADPQVAHQKSASAKRIEIIQIKNKNKLGWRRLMPKIFLRSEVKLQESGNLLNEMTIWDITSNVEVVRRDQQYKNHIKSIIKMFLPLSTSQSTPMASGESSKLGFERLSVLLRAQNRNAQNPLKIAADNKNSVFLDAILEACAENPNWEREAQFRRDLLHALARNYEKPAEKPMISGWQRLLNILRMGLRPPENEPTLTYSVLHRLLENQHLDHFDKIIKLFVVGAVKPNHIYDTCVPLDSEYDKRSVSIKRELCKVASHLLLIPNFKIDIVEKIAVMDGDIPELRAQKATIRDVLISMLRTDNVKEVLSKIKLSAQSNTNKDELIRDLIIKALQAKQFDVALVMLQSVPVKADPQHLLLKNEQNLYGNTCSVYDTAIVENASIVLKEILLKLDNFRRTKSEYQNDIKLALKPEYEQVARVLIQSIPGTQADDNPYSSPYQFLVTGQETSVILAACKLPSVEVLLQIIHRLTPKEVVMAFTEQQVTGVGKNIIGILNDHAVLTAANFENIFEAILEKIKTLPVEEQLRFFPATFMPLHKRRASDADAKQARTYFLDKRNALLAIKAVPSVVRKTAVLVKEALYPAAVSPHDLVRFQGTTPKVKPHKLSHYAGNLIQHSEYRFHKYLVAGSLSQPSKHQVTVMDKVNSIVAEFRDPHSGETTHTFWSYLAQVPYLAEEPEKSKLAELETFIDNIIKFEETDLRKSLFGVEIGNAGFPLVILTDRFLEIITDNKHINNGVASPDLMQILNRIIDKIPLTATQDQSAPTKEECKEKLNAFASAEPAPRTHIGEERNTDDSESMIHYVQQVFKKRTTRKDKHHDDPSVRSVYTVQSADEALLIDTSSANSNTSGKSAFTLF